MATIEGLAHVVRDCLEASGTTATELAISGGGSASALWCRTIANVTGVTTVRTSDSQIGAKGAMIYATVATGVFDSVSAAAAALVVQSDRFAPDPALRSLYDMRHADFLESRDAFQPRWAAWADRTASGRV